MTPEGPALHAAGPVARPSRSESVRARAKFEMRVEILEAARRALAQDGPGGVSVRAVARDVGLVSSGLYRYFASREALLTALIIESYDALGDGVEEAERAVPRHAFAQRYRAVARSARAWALAEPQQWALIFGSPIPGYDAPPDTVRAATRMPLTLARVIEEAHAAGAVKAATAVLPEIHDALELREAVADTVPDQLLVRGLVAWTYILGAVTAELFGQRHRVVSAAGAEAVYEYELDELVSTVGLLDLDGDGTPPRLASTRGRREGPTGG